MVKEDSEYIWHFISASVTSVLGEDSSQGGDCWDDLNQVFNLCLSLFHYGLSVSGPCCFLWVQ